MMIDVETLGSGPRAAIIAIGACAWEHTTILPHTFYQRIDFGSAVRRGEVDGDTIAWWFQQSDAARAAFLPPRGERWPHLPAALGRLWSYYKDVCELAAMNVPVWGNGAGFDITILEQAYTACDLEKPWDFRAARDCRTIKALAADLVGMPERTPTAGGVPHTALDDAIWQATWVSHLWTAVRRSLLRTNGEADDAGEEAP